MLKRSKLLVAFLVVTVVCASIGFAAVSDTLTVGGNMSVALTDIDASFDEDVYFSAASVDATATTHPTGTDSAALVAADVETDDADTVTITISEGALTNVGDKVVIKATITNASTAQAVLVKDKTAVVAATGSAASTDVACFTVTTSIDDTNGATIAHTTNNTLEVTITVTLVKIPSAAFTGTVTVTFEATPVIE